MEIAAKFLEKEIKFLGGRGCPLEADESVLPFLVRKGFHAKLGARPMRDATEKLVGDAVAESLLKTGSAAGRLRADATNDCLKIDSSFNRPALASIPGANS